MRYAHNCEGDFYISIWLTNGAQGPDFTVKRLEVWRESAALLWVQEGAGSFFVGVDFGAGSFISVRKVEGVGLPGAAGGAEAGLGIQGFEFGKVRRGEDWGFPETGAAEAAAEFTGGTG